MEGDFRVFGLWYEGVAKRPLHPTPLFARCLQPFTLMRYVHETFSVRLSIVRASFPFLFLWDARQEAAPIGLSSPIVLEPTHEITIELGAR